MEFSTRLERFDSNLWHFHLPVAAEFAEPFLGEPNKRRVICRVNDEVSWHAALMPDGIGGYFININKEIRKQLDIHESEEVHVRLEKDESPYGMPVPDEMAELFAQDEEGNHYFHSLTIGKQRSLLHMVGKAKGADTRMKRAIVIIEYLKDSKGRLDGKELRDAMKNSPW